MKGKGVLLLGLLLLVGVAAQACEHLEWAELKDAPQQQLVRDYCSYTADFRFYLDESSAARGIDAALRDSDKAGQCWKEADRIMRFLSQQHRVMLLNCQTNAVHYFPPPITQCSPDLSTLRVGEIQECLQSDPHEQVPSKRPTASAKKKSKKKID